MRSRLWVQVCLASLANPLVRVNSQTVRRLAALSTLTAAVNPCLVETHHIDTQSTGQESHCVSTLRGHCHALFQQTIGFPLPAPVRGTEFHDQVGCANQSPDRTTLEPNARTTSVNLNKVLSPKRSSQARCLGCGFAGWWVETMGISPTHSRAPPIR